MERIRRLVQEANNTFRTADHLVCVSYPLLRDSKILLAIVNRLYMACASGIGAVLNYEKVNKRINILPLDFESRMNVFENEVAKRIGIESDFLKVLKDLRFIMNHHKESPMEFSRGERFIICGEGYADMKTIDIEMLKSYSYVIRKFLRKVNEVCVNV